MKKTLLICFGLIIFTPLTCIGVDINHKVGAVLVKPLTVQNIQNLSFGVISLVGEKGANINVYVNVVTTSDPTEVRVQGGHVGIIKILGEGTIAITSTPPKTLIHTTDSTEILSLSNTGIIYKNGASIDNYNNIPITGEVEFATIGVLNVTTPTARKVGEYKADWPITVIYSGIYADGYEPN